MGSAVAAATDAASKVAALAPPSNFSSVAASALLPTAALAAQQTAIDATFDATA